MDKPFNCWSCGACCKNCDKIEALKEYNRGDGVCKHLTSDNLCSIYETRPEICNTKKMYSKTWSKYFTWDVYVGHAETICKILEKEMKERELNKKEE
jgi:Fe-S-cluster containining protein